MNKSIEDAVVSNLKTQFPSSTVYTGKVVEGIKATDIVVNTVYDTVTVAKGNSYTLRNSIISATYVYPDDAQTITDQMVSCMKLFTINGEELYSESIQIRNIDNTVQVLVNLIYTEMPT